MELVLPDHLGDEPADVALILLLVVILTGIAPTIFVNLLGHGYDYRTTVAPWFRGLFTGSPDVHAIATAPLIYQVHATAAWLIWAVWPFSRLVHAWSYPLWYLWRPYIVYRSRRGPRPPSPAPAAAAGGRSGCPTSRAAGLPPPWAYRQSAVRSRSSSSGRRRYSIISRTDARASRVSAKHCSADVQRTGANPCASSTTGCARPASSAASSESIGHGFPVAAAPELATCS